MSPIRGASISPRAPEQAIPHRYFEESDLKGAKSDVGMIKTTYDQPPRRPYEDEAPTRTSDSGLADVSHGSTSYERFSPQSVSTPKPHKYFEKTDTEPEQTRFELHRTREINLYKEADGTTRAKTEDISTFTSSGPDVKQESGMDYTSSSKSIPRFQPIDTRDVGEEQQRYYERRASPPRRYERPPSPDRYGRAPSPPRYKPAAEIPTEPISK